MIIQYRTTLRDWATFSFYHLSHSPLIWVMWALLLLFMLRGQVNAMHPGSPVGHYVLAIAFMAILFSAVFWSFLLLMIVISLFSRRRGNILSAHTLEITDDAVLEQTPHTRHETRWGGIQKLVARRGYLFLYLGPSAAHVIPRRAVPNEAAWRDIVARCRKHYAESRTGAR